MDQQIGGLADPWRATPRGGARLEIINRTGAGEKVLKDALDRVPAVDNSGEADFSIGGPARFTLTTPDQRTNPGTTVNWPPEDPPDDPKDGIVIDDFDYVDRSVEKIRVENPDDAEQYVIVERILEVMFVDRQTGRYKRFNFDWSKKPSSTEDHSGG